MTFAIWRYCIKVTSCPIQTCFSVERSLSVAGDEHHLKELIVTFWTIHLKIIALEYCEAVILLIHRIYLQKYDFDISFTDNNINSRIGSRNHVICSLLEKEIASMQESNFSVLQGHYRPHQRRMKILPLLNSKNN